MLKRSGLIFSVLVIAVPLVWGSDVRIVEAAKKQDTVAIATLIKQHADVNVALPDGATALHPTTASLPSIPRRPFRRATAPRSMRRCATWWRRRSPTW